MSQCLFSVSNSLCTESKTNSFFLLLLGLSLVNITLRVTFSAVTPGLAELLLFKDNKTPPVLIRPSGKNLCSNVHPHVSLEENKSRTSASTGEIFGCYFAQNSFCVNFFFKLNKQKHTFT